MSIDEIRARILPVLKKYKVSRAGLFGSMVRGEDRPDSDVDILVEIDAEISLLDFIGMKLELEEALGRKVDLGEYSAIKPMIREQILSQEVRIL